VPQTAAVKHSAGASFTVEYDGSPKFQPIDGTGMTYAVNTSASVIFSSGRYYCCDQGIWYESTAATGSWQVCKKVPDEIYTIPPSNPLYNVTYVKVYDSTPEVVYVGYTPGYTSSYRLRGLRHRLVLPALLGPALLLPPSLDLGLPRSLEPLVRLGLWSQLLNRPLHFLDRLWQGRLLGSGSVPAIPALRLRGRLPSGLPPWLRPRTPCRRRAAGALRQHQHQHQQQHLWTAREL
jgi:hypothetical protein